MRTAVLVCGVLALLAVAGVRAAASNDEGVVGEAADQAQADTEQQQQETVTVEKVLGSGGSEVVELGSSAVTDEGVHDWAAVVGGDLPVLVEFYLPTCGHCQGFVSEYERVAKAFHSQPVIVARIDANRWTSISDQYHVKGVPDLRFFPARSTDDQPYMRARVASDIVGFLNEYAGTKVAYDFSFRQQHGADAAAVADAAVVDEGTCPVVHASLLEADADADAEDALETAEAEAADAEDAVEEADEAADEAEEEADAEDALTDAIAESEAEADAHETEVDIAEEAELEGEAEAEAEADEAEADV